MKNKQIIGWMMIKENGKSTTKPVYDDFPDHTPEQEVEIIRKLSKHLRIEMENYISRSYIDEDGRKY